MQVKVFRFWDLDAVTTKIEQAINDFLLENNDKKIDQVTQSEARSNGQSVLTLIIWYS